MKISDISVIIPTHNRVAFLQEAVGSVQTQTLTPRELIIVDDGSTDETWDWLQSIRSESIRVFRQTQKGPAAARNFGVDQAKGQWIAFLDSDDLWKEKKLEIQTSFLTSHPQYQFCQTEEIWIRDGVRVNPKKKHQKPSGWIFAKCLKLCLISPSAVMLKKKFFKSLGGFDVSFEVCEDYELWLRASLRSPLMSLPNALVIKRGGHADQLSKKHWGMDRFRVRAMEKILTNENLNIEQKTALCEELELKRSILASGFQKRFPKSVNPYADIL